MTKRRKPNSFRQAVDFYQAKIAKKQRYDSEEFVKTPGDEGDIFDCDTCGELTDDIYQHESSPGEFNCFDCHSEKYPDED